MLFIRKCQYIKLVDCQFFNLLKEILPCLRILATQRQSAPRMVCGSMNVAKPISDGFVPKLQGVLIGDADRFATNLPSQQKMLNNKNNYPIRNSSYDLYIPCYQL